MDRLHVLPSGQPTLPGVLVWELAQVPVSSKAEKEPAVVQLRKVAGGVRTASCQWVAGEPFDSKGEEYPFHPLSIVLLPAWNSPCVSDGREEMVWPISHDGTQAMSAAAALGRLGILLEVVLFEVSSLSSRDIV